MTIINLTFLLDLTFRSHRLVLFISGTGQTVDKSPLITYHPGKLPGPFGDSLRSKLGFYIPSNSQGHIGTGSQHCHLWESNPHRSDFDQMPNLLTTRPLRT